MADETELRQTQKISLDELDSRLVEEKLELNPDANPMEAPPPVSDGGHRVKLVLDASSWEKKKTNPAKDGSQKDYLSCRAYGVVVDDGVDLNKRVFLNLNTLAFDGKSQMGYILLQAWGGKNNPEAVKAYKELENYVELAQAFQKTLAGEPIIRVETQWQARYNAGDKDKPDYKTAKSGMKNFPLNDPKDVSKGYRHIVDVRGSGEVSAQAVVKEFFPDTE